ncbi:MAG: glycosyltransferase family 2 protein [Bacteroides sp.]|nr:glycosyltransferase family 2 protein [Prevotella sp.]MCM1408572.1 glycosyltransferase family 2 protein [Treponema brennaborense]MCM1468939.1 glycosyltransferase family 2 protein [Bacteroides sp.]
MTPKVSIITPMYKSASLVGDTIKSVLAQTFADWEMIIVDDCSPDDGAGCRVVEGFAVKDARIKLIAAKENKGSSGARNAAMKIASGRYFAFLDSDDIWHPDYLQTMLSLIESAETAADGIEFAAIYFCGYRRMDETCASEILSPYCCKGVFDFKRLLRHCPIFPSAAIVDTEKLKEKFFFREELRALRDDYVYWLDIMEQGLCAVGFPDVLVDYRMRADSMTASKTKMIKPQWKIYREVLHFNFFKSAFYLFLWGINGLKKYKK